jgi:adenylosuccinate lyase
MHQAPVISHILDSDLWSGGFAVPEVGALFTDTARLRRWLHVEATLAAAQGELCLIPASAAECIVANARLELLDLDQIRADRRSTGHSLIPLLRALARRCGSPAGDYVHYGATTQDIQDTAQSLEIHAVCQIAERRTRALIEAAARLAERERDVAMVGRTHGVPALPITFGLKVASWVDELVRGLERLRAVRRHLPVEMFGGVGTMAAFGPRGMELVERIAKRLGLVAPLVAWHTQRDRVAELVGAFALVAGALARMATELIILSRPEIAEVSIAPAQGVLSSSTMPHKHNPEECEQIVGLWRLIKPAVAVCLDSMDTAHERDFRGVRLEWAVLPEVSQYLVSALDLALSVIGRVSTNQAAITRNLTAFGDQLCSERVMFRLCQSLGKERAYAAVTALYERATREMRPVLAVMEEDPVACRVIPPDERPLLLDPASYVGLAAPLVDRTLAHAREVIQCGN